MKILSSEQDLSNLAIQIKAWSRELGFSDVGITDIDLSEDQRYLDKWLEKGYHGEMKYMKDRQAKYSNNEKNTPKSISMSCVTDIYTELGNSDSDDTSDKYNENSKHDDKDYQNQTRCNDSDLESVTSSDNNAHTQEYSHGSDDSKSK